jgi:hypothetical protein
MKQAKPTDIQKLRDALREEVLMWLGIFGRQPITLEMYKNALSGDQNFYYLQAWGFLDEGGAPVDMTLTLNERAMTFLKDPTVIRN